MSETKTEYVVQYRRTRELNWSESFKTFDRDVANTIFMADEKRHPKLQHRLIRVTVLKESK